MFSFAVFELHVHDSIVSARSARVNNLFIVFVFEFACYKLTKKTLIWSLAGSMTGIVCVPSVFPRNEKALTKLS